MQWTIGWHRNTLPGSGGRRAGGVSDALTSHSPEHIGVYGSSAGGFITGQLLARIAKAGLPMPACAGVFSAGGDLIDFGDTCEIFTLNGFFGH
ncbi:MAG: hypothetical protein IPG06_21305 [Haliea sp.]|nr:hypothetical protein [Haliea sp.]